jgi:hypothetical protein
MGQERKDRGQMKQFVKRTIINPIIYTVVLIVFYFWLEPKIIEIPISGIIITWGIWFGCVNLMRDTIIIDKKDIISIKIVSSEDNHDEISD